MTKDRKPEPKPPAKHLTMAGHHWIQLWDEKGKAVELIVLQWSPQVQYWTQSGFAETGVQVKVPGATYIAPCPTPAMD